RTKIQGRIIAEAQLVATTLSQITLREALRREPYDFVIIDEAAAASMPLLLAGVALATKGAVLVGDYLQNSPIVDRELQGNERLKSYFGQDCFGYLSATDPVVTQRRAGCVVLTEQFRFGAAITELANRVAYRGVLRCAGNADGEVVVVTVDELPPDLYRIIKSEKSRWWVIGTLLARALADLSSDGELGVITPYAEQVTATQEALDDAAGSRDTPVGTAHAFQGRQFSTVLADLVEDGRGWVAGARLSEDPWQLSGIRVFNVAVTRAQHRLLILTTQKSVDSAAAGPLAELRGLMNQGVVRSVSAADLLGLKGVTPDYAPDSAEAELISALQDYVRVARVADEDAALPEIIERIDRAEKG
ncbi:MAG: AAA domain-containing protein, partial [Angustibacter sp.]